MKNATLRQLKIFESVARHLSFSRAAEDLHLTQPAVSTQIRTLEGHAGLPLFEQLGKKVYLTAAGTELLHHSRMIIHQFEEAEAAMAHFKGVTGGRLNIAVISAGDYFLPGLLVDFARRHEGVKINLEVLNRTDLLSHLGDNLTDLAIMVRPPEDVHMLSVPIAPHPYVIVAAPDHALARERAIPLARLAREPFIVREAGSDTRASMAEAFGRHTPKLNVGMEVRSTETIKQAVLAGMGLAFLSIHTVARELRERQLVALDAGGFPFVLRWHLVQRRNKRLPPVALAFRDYLLRDGTALIEKEAALARPSGRPRRQAAPRGT